MISPEHKDSEVSVQAIQRHRKRPRPFGGRAGAKGVEVPKSVTYMIKCFSMKIMLLKIIDGEG